MERTAILGAGSWGVALAKLLSDNGHQVRIWSIDPAEVDMLLKHHMQLDKLPGVRLPQTVSITGDLQEAVSAADLLVLAVPSVYTRQTVRSMRPFVRDGQIIVCVAKGIEEGTLLSLTQVVKEEIPQAVPAVLSGPSHAEEVGVGLPTTVVAGSASRQVAERIQDAFMNENFRVYTSPDVLGIEIGGSLKNVIALAAGMADGLGYGDNTKAALITRGIAELSRLAVAMGASVETIFGLAGIGDLIVTCESRHSRNRRAGMLLAQGYSMDEAMQQVHMVVEGVYSAKAAKALAEQYDVDMPIVLAINRVLFEGACVKDEVRGLMMRDRCAEHGSLSWKEDQMEKRTLGRPAEGKIQMAESGD